LSNFFWGFGLGLKAKIFVWINVGIMVFGLIAGNPPKKERIEAVV
jgi:hypothetical protein